MSRTKRALESLTTASASGECCICAESDDALVVCTRATCGVRVCLFCVSRRGVHPYARCFGCEDGELSLPARASSPRTLRALLSPWPDRDGESMLELHAVWFAASPPVAPHASVDVNLRAAATASSAQSDCLSSLSRSGDGHPFESVALALLTLEPSVSNSDSIVGDRAPSSIELRGERVMFGRAPSSSSPPSPSRSSVSDLRQSSSSSQTRQLLSDKMSRVVHVDVSDVSSMHCYVERAADGAGWLLRDVSLNGTYVDGVRAARGSDVFLRHGSVVQLGMSSSAVYRFQLCDASGAAMLHAPLAAQLVDCVCMVRCPCGVSVSVLDVDLSACVCLSCACGRRLCAVCGYSALDALHGHYHVQTAHGKIFMRAEEYVSLQRRRATASIMTLAHLRSEPAERYFSDASVVDFVRELHARYPGGAGYTPLSVSEVGGMPLALSDIFTLLTPIQRALGAAMLLGRMKTRSSSSSSRRPSQFNADGALAQMLSSPLTSLTPLSDLAAHLLDRASALGVHAFDQQQVLDEEAIAYPFSDAIFSAAEGVFTQSRLLIDGSASQLQDYYDVIVALLGAHAMHLDSVRRARLACLMCAIAVRLPSAMSPPPFPLSSIGLQAWDVLSCAGSGALCLAVWRRLGSPAPLARAELSDSYKSASIRVGSALVDVLVHQSRDPGKLRRASSSAALRFPLDEHAFVRLLQSPASRAFDAADVDSAVCVWTPAQRAAILARISHGDGASVDLRAAHDASRLDVDELRVYESAMLRAVSHVASGSHTAHTQS